MNTKDLYKLLPDGMEECVICGKMISWVGPNGGLAERSHARKHVREGKAVERHIQSTRSYAGYDIVFEAIEEEDLPMPEREEDFSDSRFER